MFSDIINGVKLSFDTVNTIFSPDGIDRGTLAMLSILNLTSSDKLLDLGCGYGVVGIYAAKLIGAHNVVMSDIDENCIDLSIKNAETNGVSEVKVIQSDGFKNIQEKDFTLILSNPPYHSDFSVPKHFIEKGFNRLTVGGKMIMVKANSAHHAYRAGSDTPRRIYVFRQLNKTRDIDKVVSCNANPQTPDIPDTYMDAQQHSVSVHLLRLSVYLQRVDLARKDSPQLQ